MSKYCIVLTTLPEEFEVQEIIDSVLAEKLAACIQTINIGSHYTWKEKVCHDKEVLVLFKTTWDLYEVLEKHIKAIHPYETPEVIAIDIQAGSDDYLDWINNITK